MILIQILVLKVNCLLHHLLGMRCNKKFETFDAAMYHFKVKHTNFLPQMVTKDVSEPVKKKPLVVFQAEISNEKGASPIVSTSSTASTVVSTLSNPDVVSTSLAERVNLQPENRSTEQCSKFFTEKAADNECEFCGKKLLGPAKPLQNHKNLCKLKNDCNELKRMLKARQNVNIEQMKECHKLRIENVRLNKELVKVKDDLGAENNQNFHYEMLNQELVSQNEKLVKELERMKSILDEYDYVRGNSNGVGTSNPLEEGNIVPITIEPVEEEIPEIFDISLSHVNDEHCYASSR